MRLLSQEALALESGYHRTYIGMIERGEKSLSLRTLFDLATTLKARPSAILRRVERLTRFSV